MNITDTVNRLNKDAIERIPDKKKRKIREYKLFLITDQP
jgi:hypothetical protein